MAIKKRETMVLAGDIGGTKTNVGLFVMGKKRPEPLVIQSFASREAPHLENLAERFLKSHPTPISSACFGNAGPVINGRCKTTNLPWVVSETGFIKAKISQSWMRRSRRREGVYVSE